MSKSLREAGRADQERFKKLTATRAVNHKVRSLWFQSRASWPQH